MITKSNDSKLYQDILNRANEIMVALGEPEGIINSLDSLIDHMQDLANYEKNHPELDPLVMFLPTDEGLFEINANTRIITTPDIFKNGIGVQGDEIAEILYFSIDRYFDATDLFDQDIYVQWTFKGSNTEYVTPVKWKSKAIQEGKIVFGWPISSEITERAGEIQFSIRFYKRGESESGRPILVYSLNTLISTIKINPSLNFNIADENDMGNIVVVDKSQMIYDRMESSSTAASTPIFIMPTDEQIIDLIDQDGVLSYPAEAIAGFNALARNRGDLSYNWMFQTSDASGIATPLSGADEYFITEDAERVNTKIYYTKNNDDTYSVYTPEIFESDVEIYEHKTCLNLTEIGEYWAIAKNTWPLPTANPDANINYKMAEGKSKKFIVPGPQDFNIEKPDSWNAPLFIPNKENGVDLEAPIVNGQNEKDALKYQWKFYIDSIENATAIEEATSNTLKVKEEGYYFVEIKNYRNGAETNPKNSLVRFAQPEVDNFIINGLVDENEKIHTGGATIAAGTTVTPSITIQEQNKVGELEYKWTPYGQDVVLSSDDSFTILKDYTSYTLTVNNRYKNSIKTQAFNFFAIAE